MAKVGDSGALNMINGIDIKINNSFFNYNRGWDGGAIAT
jgi:hypothetical protein